MIFPTLSQTDYECHINERNKSNKIKQKQKSKNKMKAKNKIK
jgi:hypothetical protein